MFKEFGSIRWLRPFGNRLSPALNAAAFRTRRLKIAMLSSLAGKSVSIVSQLLALPLAISSLGVEKFGVYAMLVALLNWMNMAGVAIAPGLTVGIVAANSRDDGQGEARIFTSAFLFAMIVSVLLFAGLQLFFRLVGIGTIFGGHALQFGGELVNGLHILSVFLALSVVLSVVEAAQAGYQNQYLNNLLATLGGVLSIVAIVGIVRQSPTIPNMILAIYGAPLAARLVNAVHLFWTRRYLFPTWEKFSFHELRAILTTGSAFLLTLAGSFCYQSFSVYWAGRELGAAAAAQMSVMMLVLNISGSLLIIVTQPLWPAIQDAVTRDDIAWVKRAYVRLLRNLMPYVGLAAIALGVGGNYILNFWIKPAVTIGITTQVLWGLYFFIVAWEHIHQTVLMGMSRFWFASSLFALGASIMLATSFWLANLFGTNGIFMAMCLGPLLVTAWLYPLEIRRWFADRPLAG